MKDVAYSHEDFHGRVFNRIRTLTLSEAQKEVVAKSAAGGAVLLDIYKKKVVFDAGFEHLLPLASKISVEVLHGVIFNHFFEALVRCYCRSAREVLQREGLNRLKGTHFEVMFPSKITTPNPFGRKSHRLVELQSEPILLIYPNGEITFASLDLYVLKGTFRTQEFDNEGKKTFRAQEFFPVTPIIKQGKKELEEESNLVKEIAAPYISSRILSIWTERQQDVLEHLFAIDRKRNSKEIAEILTKSIGKGKIVTKNTVDTHRRDIKARIKPFFAGYNDVDMALILKDLGCF